MPSETALEGLGGAEGAPRTPREGPKKAPKAGLDKASRGPPNSQIDLDTAEAALGPSWSPLRALRYRAGGP